MASVFGGPGYLQAAAKPITVNDAPAESVRQLFLNRAKPLSPSRERIIQCQLLRRNLLGVPLDKDWVNGDEKLKAWVQTFIPERQMTGLNLTNTLGDEIPVISHNAVGDTDRALDDADESEVYMAGLMQKLVDWDEIIGTLSDDSELGVGVFPEPTNLEMCPDFMMYVEGDDSKSLRKPNPKYDRNGPDGKRSERASIKAWKQDYDSYLAENLPLQVRLFKATDCAPVFRIGMGKQRLECRGIVVRTLFEREQLLSQGYRSKILEPGALIPMGFSSDRMTGQNGMLYLYEAFIEERDEKTGEITPFIARCVGGEFTEVYNRHSDQTESAVINLKKEYGLNRLMVSYFWGLHTSDDDPAWRGIPLMYPLLNTILGKEGLLQASKAHAHDNAFTGYITDPNPELPEKVLLDAQGNLRVVKKPKSNQIVQSTGATTPWAKASIGDDAKWLLAELSQSIIMQSPAPEQFGGGDMPDNGRPLVVGQELLTSAKRQIKEGARQAVEFIIECSVELLCGLARGKWECTQGKGVNATIAQDVKRTIDRNGVSEARTISEIIEFKERWFRDNYSVTARYPSVGNLAERRQTFDDWQAGAGTFREMRESRGDQSPETTRFEIARDKWIEGPMGQMVLAALVAKKRGQQDLAAKLQQQVDGQMAQIGLPTDALAPEFQTAEGAGPGQLHDMAGASMNGQIQGAVGGAANMGDSQAVSMVQAA